jgi:hypothetical protein
MGSAETHDREAADNPIDRAFTRIADERGDELQDNATFAYFYALEWHKAFFDLSKSLRYWDFQRKAEDAAFQYAVGYGGLNEATSLFAEIARYYKMLTFDCLSRGDDPNIQSDEEAIYRHLSEVDYAEYIPKNIANDIEANIRKIFDVDDARTSMPVLAVLPDRDISLAFAPPFGAVLSVNGEKYLYAWARGSLTPRAILPKLYVDDFDKDGADELAVILYVNSGTGVAVTELHIVELDAGMADTVVTGATIASLLFHRLSASYDPASETVSVTFDGQTIDVDASRVDKDRTKEFRGLDLESIVYFDADEGDLSVHISVGLMGFDWVTAFDYADFFADVIYGGSRLSLADCRLEYAH